MQLDYERTQVLLHSECVRQLVYCSTARTVPELLSVGHPRHLSTHY